MRFLFLLPLFLFYSPAFLLSADYVWDAELYASSSSAQKAWVIESMWAYPFEGNESILDVGSGDGAITSLLAEKVPEGKVLGFDSCLSMTEYAKKHWKRENLHFEFQDLESLALVEQFDLITLFFTFEWIQNKEKAIENAHQALFPEGRIWIVTPLDIPYELHLAATSLMNHPTWQPFFENYSLPVRYLSIKDTYALLLKNHLFSIYMRSRKKEILFPSRELFQKALLASAPYLDALPPSLKDSFLVDLVDQYIQFRPADRFGRISCSLEILEIIAMKKSAFHP